MDHPLTSIVGPPIIDDFVSYTFLILEPRISDLVFLYGGEEEFWFEVSERHNLVSAHQREHHDHHLSKTVVERKQPEGRQLNSKNIEWSFFPKGPSTSTKICNWLPSDSRNHAKQMQPNHLFISMKPIGWKIKLVWMSLKSCGSDEIGFYRKFALTPIKYIYIYNIGETP